MATTFNPSDKSTGITLSLGDLHCAVNTASTDFRSVRGTTSKSTGKWYFEFTFVLTGNDVGDSGIGVADASAGLDGQNGGGTGNAWIASKSYTEKNTTFVQTGITPTIVDTDIVGVAFDADGDTLQFYRNGSSWGSQVTGVTGTLFPWYNGYKLAANGTVNFGDSAFNMTPPSGYSAWGGSGVTNTTNNLALLGVGT